MGCLSAIVGKVQNEKRSEKKCVGAVKRLGGAFLAFPGSCVSYFRVPILIFMQSRAYYLRACNRLWNAVHDKPFGKVKQLLTHGH